jgi:hypothetical protein
MQEMKRVRAQAREDDLKVGGWRREGQTTERCYEFEVVEKVVRQAMATRLRGSRGQSGRVAAAWD